MNRKPSAFRSWHRSEICRASGLRLLAEGVSLDQAKKFARDSAIGGYHLADEPKAKRFPELAQIGNLSCLRTETAGRGSFSGPGEEVREGFRNWRLPLGG